MDKPNFKKYTKEEALVAACKMLQTKREWCKCVRSGQSLSSLKDKGIKLVQVG